MRYFSCVVFFITFNIFVSFYGNDITLLELKDCFDLILDKNDDYSSALLNLKSTKESFDEARADFYYPELDLNISGSYGYSGVISDKSINYFKYDLSTSLSINKVLYSFGKLTNKFNRYREDLNLEKVSLIIKREGLFLEVSKKFYKILLNEKILDFLEDNNKIINENLEYETRKYNNGKSSKISYLQARIDFLQKNLQLDNQKKQLITLYNELYQLIGVSKAIDLSKLEYKLKGQLDEDYIKDYKVNLEDINQILELSKNLNYEIMSSKLKLKLKILNNKIDLDQYKPTISVYGDISNKWKQNYLEDGSLGNDFDSEIGYNVGLRINIPFFGFILPSPKINSHKSSLLYDEGSEKKQFNYLLAKIEKELINRYISFEDDKNILKKYKNILELSKEMLDMSYSLYKSGSLSYIDYKKVETKYNDLLIKYYKQLYNYHVNYIELLYKIGINL